MPIALNNFPEYRPYSNVQPFTVRDGATYLLQLEALKDWLRDYVIPHINTEVTGLTETWVEQTTALIENWERLSVELVEQVTVIGNEAEASKDAAEAAKVAAEAAAALAEQFASEAEDIQDAAITLIFNNTSSQFRQAANGVYALSSDLATIETLVDSGRLSEATLDARFGDKADAIDVEALEEIVNTGRLSSATIDARFEAIIDDTVTDDDSTFSSERITELITGRVIWGNIDELPAPTAVAPGVQFACIDVPELYLNTGTQWIVIGAGGNEIGYAEVTSQTVVNNANTSPVDVPGFATTFIVGKRPIHIEISSQVAISVATSVAYLRIVLDGAEIGRLKYVAGYADVWETHSWSRVIHGLPEGSEHTVKIQIVRDPQGTGIARIAADATNPNSLKVSTV